VPAPQFEGSFPSQVDAGHIQLVWDFPVDSVSLDRVSFELQRDTNPDFTSARTIYSGQDLASFLSGLPNGAFYFRVRAHFEDGARISDWSQPVLVRVQHHSLQLAFTLFGLGAVVFISTVLLVLTGSQKSKAGGDDSESSGASA